MFTGLIQATGEVLLLTPGRGATRIVIAAPALASRLSVGDSISVSGVCLTALAIGRDQFSADLAQETLRRTTLGHLQPGATINLELPIPAGSPLGGHIVQGHVDGTGTLLALDAITPGSNQSDWRLRLELPAALVRYVVPQGSITVEGISLTVAAVQAYVVEIAVVPHTYKVTSLHTLKPGQLLNIETDVLARYAEQRTAKQGAKTFILTEAYLLANGY